MKSLFIKSTDTRAGIFYSALASAFCTLVLIIILITTKIINEKVQFFTVSTYDNITNKYLEASIEIPFRSDGELNLWHEKNGLWGAQYDIYIKNPSSKTITDYTLDMIAPAAMYIDSSWNGEYSLSNGVIHIIPSPQAYNTSIAPDETAKFGFILYTTTPLKYIELNFSGRIITKPASNPIFIIFVILLGASFFVNLLAVLSYKILMRERRESRKQTEKILRLCANFIDARDSYTKQHSANVAHYSRLIAAKLGLSEEEQYNIYCCGMLHDVGKVLVTKDILCKPSNLTEEEWVEMKMHPNYGNEISKNFAGIPGLKDAILHHHERFDGTGYPDGLKGEEIPLVSRIICVADSYDAMSTDRAYRKHLSASEIKEELKKNSGTQFDPQLADIMFNLIIDDPI